MGGVEGDSVSNPTPRASVSALSARSACRPGETTNTEAIGAPSGDSLSGTSHSLERLASLKGWDPTLAVAQRNEKCMTRKPQKSSNL